MAKLIGLPPGPVCYANNYLLLGPAVYSVAVLDLFPDSDSFGNLKKRYSKYCLYINKKIYKIAKEANNFEIVWSK